MKTILKLFLFLILVMVFALGYLGFVPGVSTIMGTNKAIDLGVATSKEALDSGNQKVQIAREELTGDVPISQSIKYEGSHPLKSDASSEELTSLSQNGGWEFSNFTKDVQVKIREDGKVETSSVVSVDKLEKYIEATNIVDVKQAKDYISKIGFVGTEIPLYTLGSGSVINNKVTMNVESIKVGRIPIPINKVANDFLTNVVQARINSIPGFSIKSVTIENGKLQFDGTVPDRLKTLKY